MNHKTLPSILFLCPNCDLSLSATLQGMQEYVCPRCAVRFRVTASVSLPPLESAGSNAMPGNLANHSIKRSFGSLVPRLRPRSERELLKLQEFKKQNGDESQV